MSQIAAHLAATMAPPVMEARRWLEGVNFPDDRPLMNLSQAAPVDPPPELLRETMAEAVLRNRDAHLYGPVLGLPDLRAEVARQWSEAYGGTITPAHVAITSGCNQAFAAAIASLAGPGDQVILPTPWYFNHKMWLDIAGVETVPLATGPDLLPDPEAAAALITPATKAIALVSPNNPCGVEYPSALITAFRDLARAHDLALIIDETYRDFHASEDRPHDLFADPDWDDTFIHLYSFSKAYRLTGHRVGALVSSPARLAEIEKFLDTVAICPGQVGQIAALKGMQEMGDWVAGERREILRRRAAVSEAFKDLEGWNVLGLGAYFAYLEHPFEASSAEIAQALVANASLLVLPGTMFAPEGDKRGETTLRLAFANADEAGVREAARRLAALG